MNAGPTPDLADRYRRVAARFGTRVSEVPPDAWNAPTPCEGWVASDVVGHLVTWVPGFFGSRGVELDPCPPVEEDPGAAWAALDAALAALFADPARAAAPFEDPVTGSSRLDEALDRFVTGDIAVHTWDLARAVGLDDTMEPDVVHEMLVGMQGIGDALVASGHYGPAVAVSAEADEATRLLALVGRDPTWSPPRS